MIYGPVVALEEFYQHQWVILTPFTVFLTLERPKMSFLRQINFNTLFSMSCLGINTLYLKYNIEDTVLKYI